MWIAEVHHPHLGRARSQSVTGLGHIVADTVFLDGRAPK